MQKGNGFNEAEIEKALGNLPRVEAPVNFETRVRSSIAEGAVETRWQPGWALGLKFALPMIALLVMGAFLLFSGGDGTGDLAVTPVNTEAEANRNSYVLPAPPGPVETPKKDEQLAVRPNNGQQNVIPPGVKPRAENAPGGSMDSTVDQDSDPQYPLGLDPSQRPVLRDVLPRNGNGIPAETILSMIGIRSECKDNGCLAAAVSKQSVAEKAGVKAGDLIEAIDDKSVKAGTVFEGAVSVRNLRVVRGGKRITINLNSK